MLIMENSEEVLQILERFTKLKQKDIPKELEDYLCYVAKTGDTVYRWANVKYLFREKLMHVIKDFHDSTPSVDDLPQYPNVDPFNYETMKSALLERLELFNAAPFTVQRLCELLTDPRKQYSRIDKYMRALEKNILVVSTVEPGRKQPESENGDSLDSVVNGDISLDVNVDIDMENESIFRMEAQNTSSTSASTNSKPEDNSGSAAKKIKIDTEDNSSDKSKSGSDSDESSDDSDSQIPKEMPKDEANVEVKAETEPPSCKDKMNGKNEEQKPQEQSPESLSPLEIKAEPSNEHDSIDSNKTDKNTTVEICPEQSEKKDEPDVSEKSDESVESSQIKKPNILESRESRKTETSTSTGAAEAPSEPAPCERDLENTHQSIGESTSVHSEPLVELTTENPHTTISNEKEKPQQSSENFSQQPEEDQPSGGHKVPEQMSIEDPQIAPIESPLQTPSTNISSEEPATSDQPMDENLDQEISSTCAADSSCIDEVVMQSESDMATEPIKVGDDKTGPTGMDVDDTSQEEAMDQ